MHRVFRKKLFHPHYHLLREWYFSDFSIILKVQICILKVLLMD